MEQDVLVGKVLRRLRLEQALSQEKLALEAGVERNYISLIELGRNSPSVRLLSKVCRVLDIKLSAFFALVEGEADSAGGLRPRKK